MKTIKIAIVLVGIIIVATGGWLAWRNAHPALPDAQQLQANLKAISEAAARHSSGGILDYLAEGFTWNGQNRHDVASMLSGAMFEFDTVRIDTSSVKVQLNGASAVTTGEYALTVRERKQGEDHIYRGNFRIEWEKQGGQWLAVKATSEGNAPV